jgi:hypothetical protein
VAVAVFVIGHGWWLVALLTVVWGVRLGWHIGRRQMGAPPDQRYVTLLASARRPALAALGKVYLTQAVTMWFVSLPVQVASWRRGGWTHVAVGMGDGAVARADDLPVDPPDGQAADGEAPGLAAGLRRVRGTDQRLRPVAATSRELSTGAQVVLTADRPPRIDIWP